MRTGSKSQYFTTLNQFQQKCAKKAVVLKEGLRCQGPFGSLSTSVSATYDRKTGWKNRCHFMDTLQQETQLGKNLSVTKLLVFRKQGKYINFFDNLKKLSP